MSDISKEVSIQPSDEQEGVVSSLTDTMTTKQLRTSLDAATKQRELIKKFVNEQLVKGIDFGEAYPGSSKPTLLKPGQEKIFSLMNITSRLEKDEDTLSMLPDEKGLVAYLCRAYRKGEEVAQGRGAAKIGDKKRDANSTIKIAEKRARMDACLSLGFSEFFTQDMEDPEYQRPTNNNNQAVSAPKENPATPKQRDYIKSLVKELLAKREVVSGNYIVELYKINGVTDPANMTFEQASNFITALKDGKAKLPDEAQPADPTPPVEPQVSPDDNIIEGEVVEPEAPKVDGQFEDRLAVAKTYLIDECEFKEDEADMLIDYWSGVTGNNPFDELAVKRIENTIKAVSKKFIKEALVKAKEVKGVQA